MRRVFVSSLVALGLIACTGKEQERAPAAPGAASKRAATSPPPRPAGPPLDANDAYLHLGGDENTSKLWRIHQGKVHALSLGAACGQINEIALDADSTLWVVCTKGAFRVKGSSVEKLGGTPPSGHGRFAFGPGGRGAHYASLDGVYQFVDDKWIRDALPSGATGAKTGGPGVPSIYLAVDKDRTLWLSVGKLAWKKTQGGWSALDLPKEPLATLIDRRPIAANGAGQIFIRRQTINNGYGFLQPKGDALVALPQPMHKSAQLATVLATLDGGLYLRTFGTALESLWTDKAGKITRRLPLRGKFFGWPNDNSDALDAAGRLWLGTNHGVVIAGADGSFQQWEHGQVDGLPAAWVRRIAVGGKGPTLPSLRPKARGTIKGKVVDAPNTPVELCHQGGIYRSPCAQDAPMFRGKTDAEGNFRFEGVPPFYMKLFVKIKGSLWRGRYARCCVGLKQGEERDVGTFER